MQRRHVIISAILLAVILTAAGLAWRVWRQQERRAVAIAGVPTMPDLSRWPAELPRRIQEAGTDVREAKDPVPPLAQLATLYYANNLVVPARQALEAMRQLEPKNARWPYWLADMSMRAVENAAAEQALLATVQLDPTYLTAWFRLGYLRSLRNEFGPARECYAQAAAIAPGNLYAQFLLISFDARNDSQRDPRRRLIALVEAHPGFKELHKLLAELHAAAGDAGGAAEERRRAAAATRELENDDVWVNETAPLCYDTYRLGVLAREALVAKRFGDAEDLHKRAVLLAPADSTLRVDLATHYESVGRPDDARATVEKALADFPDNLNLRLLYSRMLCSAHRVDEAIAMLQGDLVHHPADAGLRAGLGFALGQAGKNAEAVVELRESIRLDPTQIESHYNLAYCLQVLGQPAEAQKAAEEALAMRPDYPEALVLLSGLAIDARDIATAERRVNQLVALDPEAYRARVLFAALQLLKGNAAEQAGNVDEAGKRYRAGLEAAPDYAPLLREWGMLALRRKQFAEATEALEHYVRVSPEDPDGYILLGKALRAAGRAADARQFLEHGLDLARKTGNRGQIQELQRLLAL